MDGRPNQGNKAAFSNSSGVQGLMRLALPYIKLQIFLLIILFFFSPAYNTPRLLTLLIILIKLLYPFLKFLLVT